MGFGALLAQGQADADTVGFRREERDEEILGAGQARAFVLNPDLKPKGAAVQFLPADPHTVVALQDSRRYTSFLPVVPI